MASRVNLPKASEREHRQGGQWLRTSYLQKDVALLRSPGRVTTTLPATL